MFVVWFSVSPPEETGPEHGAGEFCLRADYRLSCARFLATPRHVLVGQSGRERRVGIIIRNGEAWRRRKRSTRVALDKHRGPITSGCARYTAVHPLSGFRSGGGGGKTN